MRNQIKILLAINILLIANFICGLSKKYDTQ